MCQHIKTRTLELHSFSILVVLCILFFGCIKVDFLYKDTPSCRIVSMTNDLGEKADFFYTSWGDPKFIDVSNNESGSPDFYFKYDNNKRLVEFQAAYDDNEEFFESLRRYYYQGNKIVKDSVFTMASI